MKKGSFFLRISCALLAAVTVLSCAFASGISAGSLAEVDRIWGESRMDTAYSVASRIIAEHPSDTLIVSNGLNFPDTLAAVSFATANNAPILLTDGKSLDDTFREKLETFAPEQIFILGGKLAVSPDIENELKEKCGSVSRLAGQSRFETACAVASQLDGYDTVFIANGMNYPDALSIGPVAGILGCPVLFAMPDGSFPEAVSDFISECGAKNAVIIGGPYAVGAQVVKNLSDCGIVNSERVYGESRFDTSLEICKKYKDLFDTDCYSFATGESFPDALTGSVYSAVSRMPILLTSEHYSNDAVKTYFLENDIRRAVIYGGKYVVSDITYEYVSDRTAPFTTTTTTTTKATTKATTKPTTQPTTAASKKNHADVLNPDYKSPYYIIVYTKSNTVRILAKNSNGKYDVKARNFICSTAKNDGKHKTPAGLYSIDTRYAWRAMFGGVYAQYAVRFYGNYLFHSVPYVKQAKNTLETEEYQKLGSPASLGCVRLCARDAQWIYLNCPNGTQVRVISGKNGPAKSECVAVPPLKSGAAYKGWDPSDTDGANPYNK